MSALLEIRQALVAISCPFASLVSQESVLTPCDLRFRLLEWLLLRFDPQLDAVDIRLVTWPKYAGKSARLEKITLMAATIGLCRTADISMVQGLAPEAQQIDFIRDLIDMVRISEEKRKMEQSTPGGNEEKSPKNSSTALSDAFVMQRADLTSAALRKKSSNLDSTVAKSCAYLDTLASNDMYLRSLLSATAPQVIPKELALLADSHVQRNFRSKKISFDPRLSDLERMLADDVAHLEESMKELSQLGQEPLERSKSKGGIGSAFSPGSEALMKKLQDACEQLSDQIDDFDSFYPIYVEPWVVRQNVEKSELGDKSVALLADLEKLRSSLQYARMVRNAHTGISGLFDADRSDQRSGTIGKPDTQSLADRLRELESDGAIADVVSRMRAAERTLHKSIMTTYEYPR